MSSLIYQEKDFIGISTFKELFMGHFKENEKAKAIYEILLP